MTEQEWMVSNDPAAMLDRLRPDTQPERSLASNRKLRLFAEAAGCPECARLMGGRPPAEHAEYVAQAQCSTPAAKAALLREIVGSPFAKPIRFVRTSGWMSTETVSHVYLNRDILTPQALSLARAAYESRGRCGNGCSVLPNPPVGLKGKSLKWREGVGWHECPECHGTGQDGSGHLDNATLAVLSDALEESGCSNETILQHLRGYERCPPTILSPIGWRECGPHVRGCWSLDLILGKT